MSIFEVALESFIDMNHKLVLLSRQIDWEEVESEFAEYYCADKRASERWQVSGKADYTQGQWACEDSDRHTSFIYNGLLLYIMDFHYAARS